LARDKLREAEMERELWSRDDLRNAIVATYYAGVASQPATDSAGARCYAEGFQAALAALALHFGLAAHWSPAPEARTRSRATGRDETETRIFGR
jgi:hypothetical protein